MQCGNVWLGLDTQITAKVLGPECKAGERPQGGQGFMSQSTKKIKSRETILAPSSTTPEWRCLCY